MEEKKYPIPHGKAANEAKRRYRDKNYDRIELALPKGTKAAIKAAVEEQGKSISEFIFDAIKETIDI
ncbi:MAG: antitoxin [Johnsonella sp.]|nr:antitoxin [Johnsonella sp.]